MLAKKFRLPIQDFFGGDGSEGAGIIQKRNRSFILRVKNNGLEFGRFGAIISQKVSKSAVRRNQLRRIIFDAIRADKERQKKQKDFLITVLSSVNQLDKSEIKREILSLIKEIK